MSTRRPGDDDLERWLAGEGPQPRDLDRVIDGLRAPTVQSEIADETFVVGRMAAVLTQSVSPQPTRGAPVLGRFSRRSVVLAFAGTLAFGGAAAAASTTGVLDVFDGEPAGPVDESTTTLGGESTTSLEESTTSAESTTSLEETTTTLDGTTPTTVDNDLDDDGCDDDLANHGEHVSAVAHDKSVEDHGAAVSEAAQSDCGKPDHDATDDDESDDDESDESDDADDDSDGPGSSNGHGNTDDDHGNGGDASSQGGGNGDGHGGNDSDD